MASDGKGYLKQDEKGEGVDSQERQRGVGNEWAAPVAVIHDEDDVGATQIVQSQRIPEPQYLSGGRVPPH